MIHSHAYSIPRQDTYPKIVDIATGRSVSEGDQPGYDDGFVPEPEPVAMSATFETRRVVKECGPIAAAVHRFVFENDQDGAENTYLSLAEAFEYSTRQMVRLVQKLEQHGFLEVSRAEGKSRPSIIKAVIPGVTSGVTPVSRCDTSVSAVGMTSGVTSPPHTPLTTKQDINNDEVEEPPLVPPKQKRQRTRSVESAATTVPSLDEFEVTDEMRAKAVSYGVPADAIDLETQKWFWHHDTKESRFKNWRSSWYGWMTRAPEMSGYNRRKAQQNGVVKLSDEGLPLMANGAVDLSEARKMGLLG